MGAVLTAGHPERVRHDRMKKLLLPPLGLIASAVASWAASRLVKRIIDRQSHGAHS